MGKVKDLLWEPKQFDEVWDEMINDNDPARDYHEAITSLKAIVSTHLDSTDRRDTDMIWRINDMISRLEKRLLTGRN